MAIHPPEQRLWWNEPVERGEIVWIAIAFLWGVFMFLFMIWWHFTGQQNLSNEAYRIDPAVYAERTEAFAEQYTVREEGDRIAALEVSGPAPPRPSICRGSGLPMIRRRRASRSLGSEGRSPSTKKAPLDVPPRINVQRMPGGSELMIRSPPATEDSDAMPG